MEEEWGGGSPQEENKQKERKKYVHSFSLVVVSIPSQSSLSQRGSSQADISQAVQTSIRMFGLIDPTNTARREQKWADDERKSEEERKGRKTEEMRKIRVGCGNSRECGDGNLSRNTCDI